MSRNNSVEGSYTLADKDIQYVREVKQHLFISRECELNFLMVLEVYEDSAFVCDVCVECTDTIVCNEGSLYEQPVFSIPLNFRRR